jgi:hypothetical protein
VKSLYRLFNAAGIAVLVGLVGSAIAAIYADKQQCEHQFYTDKDRFFQTLITLAERKRVWVEESKIALNQPTPKQQQAGLDAASRRLRDEPDPNPNGAKIGDPTYFQLTSTLALFAQRLDAKWIGGKPKPTPLKPETSESFPPEMPELERIRGNHPSKNKNIAEIRKLLVGNYDNQILKEISEEVSPANWEFQSHCSLQAVVLRTLF